MPKKYTRIAYKNTIEAKVRSVVKKKPELVKTENTNDLIRAVWKAYGDDINAIRIRKTAGILRTEIKLGIKK